MNRNDSPTKQFGRALLLPLSMLLLLLVAVFFGALHSPFSGPARSPAPAAADPLDDAEVLAKLAALGFEDVSLMPGHTDGWHAVSTHQGLYYINQDATLLVAGQWFAIADTSRVENLSEAVSAQMRLDRIAALRDSAIVFGEADARYQVSVFTDHTCGYCRRLHQTMDDYLAADIAIHYYAFPRAGMGAQGADELAAVWCADDPQSAMDKAKSGAELSNQQRISSTCKAQVESHLRSGRASGVQGTPAMVLPDGRLITGFRSAQALLNELEQTQ